MFGGKHMNDDDMTPCEGKNVTVEDLIAEYIRTPEQRRMFLRKGWIHDVIMQLIRVRCDAGLTQAELGERLGKQQSAIARLERGDDLKLSTLFDYLAALDLTPADQIPLGSYSEAVRRIPGAEDLAGEDSSVQQDSAPSVLAAD
jgi:transcriptional regulator with XRE-family HTH domain